MALAVLRRYTNLPEAYAAAGALRTAGLHPSVFNWIAGTVLPSSHTERAGYRLGVPEEEAWRAAEILALEHWHEALVFADDEQDWELPRPRPRWSAWWRLLWVLVTLTSPPAGILFVLVRRRPRPVGIALLAAFVLIGAFFWGIAFNSGRQEARPPVVGTPQYPPMAPSPS